MKKGLVSSKYNSMNEKAAMVHDFWYCGCAGSKIMIGKASKSEIDANGFWYGCVEINVGIYA